MTLAPGSALTTGSEPARAVTARVLADLDDIVPRMGQAYRDEIPEYGALPPDQMEREVLQTSRGVVEAFFNRVVAGDETRTIDVPRAIAGAGRKRLRMGVPLEASLHAFRIAGRVVWEAVVEATRPGEEAALATLAAQWIDYVDRASTAFAEGYLDASHDHLRRLDTRRRAIVDALLEATGPGDAAAVASEYSLVLAPAYTPVLADGPDVTTRIDSLLAVAPKDTLAGFRGDRVLLLVPNEVTPSALRSVAGAGPIVLAWSTPAAVGDALPDRVRHAATILDAAMLTGVDRGAFGPDDLVVEQLLVSSPRTTETLRRTVLDRLGAEDSDGVFLATLRTYLDCGSVPDTAKSHVCHANTVAYRLNRVAEITGLDPRVPKDSAVLYLATTLEGSSS